MISRGFRSMAVLFSGLVLMFASYAQADDWTKKSVKVAGGGTLSFEFPKSWGKKPELDSYEGLTTIRFGPFGTRKKPVFLLHIASVTAIEPVTSENILKETEAEIINHKKIAAETDISINDLQGDNVAGHYYSFTDRDSKVGEYDYLTLAVLGAGNLMVKCYFFSSDGAPDFGADAMQMMRSIKYTEPPPKPEKGKR